MQNIEFTNKSKNGIEIRRNSDYNFLVSKRSNETSKEELDMSNQENVFETILAPMTGTAVAITEVPDPIFIEKILGDGVAIVPTEGKVVSPVDGTVSKVAETGHIYAVTSDNGVEVVIHVGLETVALNGKCFQIHVKEGDKVKAGDLLADADLEFIKETGRNSITPIVIGSSLEGKDLVCEEGEVQAGKTVIMEIKQK